MGLLHRLTSEEPHLTRCFLYVLVSGPSSTQQMISAISLQNLSPLRNTRVEGRADGSRSRENQTSNTHKPALT